MASPSGQSTDSLLDDLSDGKQPVFGQIESVPALLVDLRRTEIPAFADTELVHQGIGPVNGRYDLLVPVTEVGGVVVLEAQDPEGWWLSGRQPLPDFRNC